MNVPELPNQEALDSFIVMNGIRYVFQFTIAKEHDIKPGLFDFFSGYIQTGVSFSSSRPISSWYAHSHGPSSTTLLCGDRS